MSKQQEHDNELLFKMIEKKLDEHSDKLDNIDNKLDGVPTRVVDVSPADIAATRKRLRLSQARFALTFGISPATLRDWEQGRRHPEGPAKVLLRVIDKEPEAVLRALHAT